MTSPESFPVEDARKKFADILDGTQFRSTHAQITRRGKRAGYVVPPEWYDRAVEALAREQGEPPAVKAAVAAPRRQVTQALRKPAPSISPKVMALPRERIKELADLAQDHYPDWVEEIEREYPQLRGPDLDLVIVELGYQKGFKIPELDEPTAAGEGAADGEHPASSEETSG